MLFHRQVFADGRYQERKMRALHEDPGRQNDVRHNRDIMPDCVLKLVISWLPNLDGDPYMGHKWE